MKKAPTFRFYSVHSFTNSQRENALLWTQALRPLDACMFCAGGKVVRDGIIPYLSSCFVRVCVTGSVLTEDSFVNTTKLCTAKLYG